MRNQFEGGQIPGQDTILNHPELLPENYKTDITENGELVPAAVEIVLAQMKKECMDLINAIYGDVTLEKYADAYCEAGKLLKKLEEMKC